MLALGRYLVPVKERALLGEDESGAIALGVELNCGDGDRDADPVQEHLVRIDDALARDDVPEARLVGVFAAVGQDPPMALPSTDAEVELVIALRTVVPARLGLRVGPGGKCSVGGGIVDALDNETAVLYRSFAYRVPAFGGSSSLSAR